MKRQRRGPFLAVLDRIRGKGGWTYVTVPKRYTPPITRAWGRTPVVAVVDGHEWTTSVWRSRTGTGFLPVPKRVRGPKGKGDTVEVAFTFEDE